MTRKNFWRTLKIVGLALAIWSLDLIWPDLNLIPILTAVVMAVWLGCQLWLHFMGWQPPAQHQTGAGRQPSHLFSIT